MVLDFKRFAVSFRIKAICGLGTMFNLLVLLPVKYEGERIDTQLVFILCSLKKKKTLLRQVILMKSCYKEFHYLVTF